MLNFYSSQIDLCNHFRYNEELNGHAKVKSKFTKFAQPHDTQSSTTNILANQLCKQSWFAKA